MHSVDGIEALASSPQELTAFIRAEMAKWAKVVQAAGIKPASAPGGEDR